MNQPTYQIELIDDNTFTFLSVGENGIILKVVRFDEIENRVLTLDLGIMILKVSR